MRAFWALSRVAFYGLLVMLALWIATAVLLPKYRPDPAVGCWARNIVGLVKCRGFPGSNVASFTLSMPLLVFLSMPTFFVYEVSSGLLFEFARKHPSALAVQIGFTAWLVMGLLYPLRVAYLRLRTKPSPNRSEPRSLD